MTESKSRFTKEQLEVLLGKIGDGIPEKYAFQGANIPMSTYYAYLKIGEDVESTIEGDDDLRSKLTDKEVWCVEFLELVRKARVKALERNILLVNVAAKDDWKAAAW